MFACVTADSNCGVANAEPVRLSAELAEPAGAGESRGDCKSGENSEPTEECEPGDGQLSEFMALPVISWSAQHANASKPDTPLKKNSFF